jgi:GNAT superfamily N-acetyltransferase
MIKIIDFNKTHIHEAKNIALMNYGEERFVVSELPLIDALPDLEHFASNDLGVSMFSDNKLIGFLCCYDPWDNAFDSTAKGTFSPIHAHGAVSENRGLIFKKLYQAAAEKWVKNQITYHAIGLYAHDNEAVNSLFTYGFGLRCIDAIKSLNDIKGIKCEGVKFSEITKDNIEIIREMRYLLSSHLAESPCFMSKSSEKFQNWLKRAEARNSRVFIAEEKDKAVAFIEARDDGENFVSEQRDMKNICGAFCLPEYRGTGVIQGLLNFLILTFREEGYKNLGTDFESFNSTANGFWLKFFTPYCYSLVRRIDECALID